MSTCMLHTNTLGFQQSYKFAERLQNSRCPEYENDQDQTKLHHEYMWQDYGEP